MSFIRTASGWLGIGVATFLGIIALVIAGIIALGRTLRFNKIASYP
jgi:hypothetical protein